MDRLEYAHHNRHRYLDWCHELELSPYSAVDKMEWAIISAHCKFSVSLAGFKATRDIEDLQALADALYANGVLAPGNKAAYILDLRDRCLYGETPLPEACYQTYRREYKFRGLGHCKLSFGSCLIDPLGSNVVCLDTHILQVYLGYRPTPREINRIYTKLDEYEDIESFLLAEAEEVDLPPFAYQWAVWDWKRARYDLLPPSDHSFLWRNPTQEQLPLFSSLEV
ncbi:hypothetical protein LCGC14_2042770 [marine sediment metagenome]|uniref:HhH-GPD domain-containing protein n=1 Tax=marine sediment metagenome TaxID=412755 RepID=A0A0F9ERK0_9ZZZZ